MVEKVVEKQKSANFDKAPIIKKPVSLPGNGEPCVLKPRSYKELPSECGKTTFRRPHLYVDEKGNKKAEPGEEFDLDGYIQSQAGSTDIAAILARYEAGDLEAINVNPNGFTGDSTILPKDLYDVKAYDKIYQDAADNFNKLPDDVKKLFGNDSTQFFNSVMNGTINSILGKYEADKTAAAKTQTEVEANG